MIRIRNMTYRIAGRTLFDSASASVPTGHKVGLVGRNGTGKSTLLKLLAGAAQPDAGELAIDGIAGIANAIGMVEQEAPSGTETPLGFTLAADRERGALLAEAESTHDPLRISEIQNRLADIGAHAAPARAASILAGLGFDDAEQHRPLSNFSGGWRMRVALAALLFTEPELLLLDEPTNHLDLEASLWLETHLRNYAKTLIVVSHDRELLNRSVTGILHLEAEKLTFYTGGYDRFAQVREERLALEEATARKQTLRRRHIQSFIDRFRYKASKARQAQSRLKALERMDAVSITAADPDTVFRFPQPDRLPPPLLSFERAAVGYVDGLPVLRNLDFRLDGEDRIGFLGRNGNGKSTLARLIAGRLPPMSGIMHRSPKLRIGFFTQHQIDDLVADDSPTAHMARLMPGAPPSRVRTRLGGVGLTQDRQITPVKHLSGGEKARLTLALLMHDSPHVLILDEPTNHLDMDARDALVSAVNDFQGAVILISHDRRLMELSVDQLWLVADETVKPFDGDLTDYEAWTREARATSSNGGAGNAKRASPLSDGRANRRDTRRDGAERRRKNADIRKTVRDAERALERLAEKRNSLMKKLGNTAFYQEQSTQEIKNVILQKEAIDSAIETAEADWLAASESLDASE